MSDPQTFWNGEPTKAERMKVVVHDSGRFPTYWARKQDLVGKEIDAVRVEYGASVFYIDDRDGSGWELVTKHRGTPQREFGEIEVSRHIIKSFPLERPSSTYDTVEVIMPAGAKILHAALDGGAGMLCVLARVDLDQMFTDTRSFVVFRTDEEFYGGHDLKHISTLRLPGMKTLRHVFEIR